MEWQPIETAPKDGTAILLSIPGNKNPCAHVGFFHHDTDQWRERILGANFVNYPSHWMPLPKPPKDQ